MTAQVKLAVVGLGWWGAELVKGVRSTGIADVTACYARTAATRDEFAAQHGMKAATSYEALLSDPDIDGVLLATSHSSHGDLTVQAASAGKHIFVEKPFTLTVEDGRRAMKAASEAGVVLQVGHNRRRQPANRRLKEMIDSGEMGLVVATEATHAGGRGLALDPAHWRAERAESPLSGMTGMGVHQLENMLWLIGPIKSVSAHSNRLLKRTDLDDASVLSLQFHNGVVGSLVTSYVTPAVQRIGVLGTVRSAWNEIDGKRLLVQEVSDKEPTEVPVEPLDTVADQLHEFASSILGTAKPETGGLEGLRVVAVMEAAIAAADRGVAVEVEDVG
ncbi:MAG TPA: Gfo/Idh/MocA family oxidoreductase [Acidimicrobiia bacterium]|nr:Gfo/Idh/MocA family oxidoreductase [Acidimicrobiia bacterium]